MRAFYNFDIRRDDGYLITYTTKEVFEKARKDGKLISYQHQMYMYTKKHTWLDHAPHTKTLYSLYKKQLFSKKKDKYYNIQAYDNISYLPAIQQDTILAHIEHAENVAALYTVNIHNIIKTSSPINAILPTFPIDTHSPIYGLYARIPLIDDRYLELDPHYLINQAIKDL